LIEPKQPPIGAARSVCAIGARDKLHPRRGRRRERSERVSAPSGAVRSPLDGWTGPPLCSGGVEDRKVMQRDETERNNEERCYTVYTNSCGFVNTRFVWGCASSSWRLRLLFEGGCLAAQESGGHPSHRRPAMPVNAWRGSRWRRASRQG